MDGAGAACGQCRCDQVQPGAEAQFGDPKAGAQPHGQVVARQKDMPGFRKPVRQAEIGVIEQGRDGDQAVAPCGSLRLVLGAHLA